MPSLRVMLPGKGPKVYHLYKKLTSVGRGEENDTAAERTHEELAATIHGYLITVICGAHLTRGPGSGR